MFRRRNIPEVVAAVDLGSNSFHMIVARVADGNVHVLDRLRETVRLAGGLDERNQINQATVTRALETLCRFGQRVQELPPGSVRAVGTNTLRKARNSAQFLTQAQRCLGHPIEVIGGREEARLIYLGVSHCVAQHEGHRLVVDIGGGSTEVIIGERFNALHTESLHMGCVNMTRLYFPKGQINDMAWRAADIAARLEIQPIEQNYRRVGWQVSFGASGTALAIERVLREQGWSMDGITPQGLHQLRAHLIKVGNIQAVNLQGLNEERKPVFVGGVVVLLALFEALGIERMQVSEGALREGLIYDLLGRIRDEDVRARTVSHLMRRFQIETSHATRVQTTALYLLNAVSESWELDEVAANFLSWAAHLHELGRSISHSQYHKHGAYIIENSDLAGFSREDQHILAILVRTHRRKLSAKPLRELDASQHTLVLRLVILLRLAVLLHRNRTDEPLELLDIKAREASIKLHFTPGWLAKHPLTRADLELEASLLKGVEIKLKFE